MPATPTRRFPIVRSAVGLDPDDAGMHALLLRFLIESGRKDAAEEQYAVSLRQLRDNDAPVEPLVAAWQELRRKAPCATARGGGSGSVPASAPGLVRGGAEVRHRARRLRSPDRRRPSAPDPEELSKQADTLAALRPLIERLRRHDGGDSLGNSAIVLFGASRTLEDHAVQACRAALAMRSAIAADNGERQRGELGLSACLDAGEVLVRTGAAGRSRPSDPPSRPPPNWCICCPPA